MLVAPRAAGVGPLAEGEAHGAEREDEGLGGGELIASFSRRIKLAALVQGHVVLIEVDGVEQSVDALEEEGFVVFFFNYGFIRESRCI